MKYAITALTVPLIALSGAGLAHAGPIDDARTAIEHALHEVPLGNPPPPPPKPGAPIPFCIDLNGTVICGFLPAP